MAATFEDLPKLILELQQSINRIENYLLLQNNNVSEDDKLLNIDEAATFLSLKKSTIYYLISKRELPVLKKTKRCYFLKSDLISYLKSGGSSSTEQLKKKVEAYFASK